MPTTPKSADNYAKYDSLEVEVFGDTMEDLKSLAEKQAAAFFGVLAEDYKLETRNLRARAIATDHLNRPTRFTAIVRVVLIPAGPPAETKDDDTDSGNGSPSVPGGTNGGNRPAGPPKGSNIREIRPGVLGKGNKKAKSKPKKHKKAKITKDDNKEEDTSTIDPHDPFRENENDEGDE